MSVMFLYDRYIRLFGIRRIGGLENPKVRPIERFSLPRGTVFHYMPENETEIGPDSEGPVIKAAQRMVYIDHVKDLLSKEGAPRPTYKLINPMITQYRRENMMIRPLRKYDDATRDLTNMVVINYSMIGHLYRYTRSALSRWWYWKNIRTTLWKKINELKTENERHHIVVFDIPKSLPSISDLRKGERGITPQLAKVFNTRERLDLLDLWTWLGDNRDKCPMGQLDESRLNEINLLIRRETGFIVINLGTLNGWRKAGAGISMESFQSESIEEEDHFDDLYEKYTYGEVNEIPFVADDEVSMEAITGIDPKVLQLRFLRMLTRIVAQTNTIADVNAQSEIDRDEDDSDEDDALDQTLREQSGTDQILMEDVEEELSEELDAPASDDETIITDEDGDIVIETAEKTDTVVDQVIGHGIRTHTLTSAIDQRLDELVDKGVYTAAQYRRMKRLAESYETLPNPWDKTKTIAESLKITDEDTIIQESDTYTDMDVVKDKSMLKSSVEKMDSQYIQKVMKKDILNAVMSVQKAGVAVTDYKVEQVEDAVSNYEIHRVQLTPVVGKPSTITFRIPVVDKNGVYVSNGQRWRSRTQKADIPIRKVNHSRVALTSYYSKIFIDRSARAVFSYDGWIAKAIVHKGLDKDDPLISSVKTADVAVYNVKLPNIYTIIAARILSMTSNGNYWFDYNNRKRSKLFDMDRVAQIESEHSGWVVCGRRDDSYIAVDDNNMFYLLNGDVVEELGQAEELFGLDQSKAPVSLAEISIFGKTMPVGMALGYLLGFDQLIKLTGAKYRVVPVGERLNMAADEYAIRFLDENIVMEKSDVYSAMIFAGFTQYHNQIKNYSRHTFNATDVYFNVLGENGIGLRYLRELDQMNAMWVDPITADILRWMKEPVEFIKLLLRAVELLVSRYVPEKVETTDGVFEGMERAKGYERIPGLIYSELVKSIRTYNARNASGNSQITMKPYEILMGIVQDPAATIIDDINPIQNLKQKEIITYGGRGGRTGRSMTAKDRLFKESDIGFISESTVDSGDVAVITYMTPNANITSVRGTVRSYDKEKDGPSSLVSTSALISPFADRDDPKRVNFIGIQQSHVIASKGYRASPIATGYDHVIAHRVDDIFASSAEDNGEVVERSDDHIVIAYENGNVEHIDLTTQFGISAGSVYPQYQASEFKLGDKVKKGDIVKYNSGFFTPSKRVKGQVQWKAGIIARTALMEAGYTLEDSSAIDDWLAKQLVSEVTKVKTIVVRFDQTIRGLVKVGDHVDISSILCTIEDAVTADSGLFSEEDLETLKLMSSAAPTAGAVGDVAKIEVFYHGDPDDMSDSLLELVSYHDKERRKVAKRLGKKSVTGQVDQSLRIDGDGLELDHVAIKVYINHVESMGVGDKAVFSNQMKTVIGHRLSGINETESGRPVRAIFGAKSIMDRIVESALLIGMSISVQQGIGEIAAKMWLEDK